jgi:hypothetical protein
MEIILNDDNGTPMVTLKKFTFSEHSKDIKVVAQLD